jgi:hypothetical protein
VVVVSPSTRVSSSRWRRVAAFIAIAPVARLDGDGSEVRQALFLGFLDVAEQGRRGGDAQRLVFDAESAEIMQVEELQQLATAAVGIEQPRRASTQAGVSTQRCGQPSSSGTSSFGWLEACEFGFERIVGGDFVDQEAAARDPPRPGRSLASPRQREQQVSRRSLSMGFVGDGARRDDADDLAFDQAFRQRRIADLLADRDRFAKRHQSREIAFVCMRRHAGHRDRLPA